MYTVYSTRYSSISVRAVPIPNITVVISQKKFTHYHGFLQITMVVSSLQLYRWPCIICFK